ncbi:MAG: Nramp family divalent metal transporter [bacterium]
MKPLRPASLPPRPNLWAALGPGVVWLALAQGSGELVWWPYCIAKYGLGFLALLAPACFLQWPLNVAIGRYTAFTGESIWQGFVRLHRGFAFGLWLLMAASFLWFGGFASAGGEAIASLTGVGTPVLWGFVTVAIFFLALIFSKAAYTLIERFMSVVAITTVVGLAWATMHPTVRARIPEFTLGVLGFDHTLAHPWDPKDATKLLTAITFAGLGGFWTLFYSSWLREKGTGMAARMGRVTSPVTGKGEFIEDAGFVPREEPELAAHARGWVRFLWLDAGVGVIGNLATTFATCLLAYAVLLPKGLVPTEQQLVTLQAEFFAVSWGETGRRVFLVVAAAFLADTWLATVDAVAHTHTEMSREFIPKLAKRWDYRTTYYGWVVVLTIVSCVTMAAKSPQALILTSAVIGFVGTVLYSSALVVLNYRLLPRLLPAEVAPRPAGKWLLIAVVSCYVGLAVAYLVQVAPQVLGLFRAASPG